MISGTLASACGGTAASADTWAPTASAPDAAGASDDAETAGIGGIEAEAAFDSLTSIAASTGSGGIDIAGGGGGAASTIIGTRFCAAAATGGWDGT